MLNIAESVLMFGVIVRLFADPRYFSLSPPTTDLQKALLEVSISQNQSSRRQKLAAVPNASLRRRPPGQKSALLHLLRCAPRLGRSQVGTGKQARRSNGKAGFVWLPPGRYCAPDWA